MVKSYLALCKPTVNIGNFFPSETVGFRVKL